MPDIRGEVLPLVDDDAVVGRALSEGAGHGHGVARQGVPEVARAIVLAAEELAEQIVDGHGADARLGGGDGAQVLGQQQVEAEEEDALALGGELGGAAQGQEGLARAGAAADAQAGELGEGIEGDRLVLRQAGEARIAQESALTPARTVGHARGEEGAQTHAQRFAGLEGERGEGLGDGGAGRGEEAEEGRLGVRQVLGVEGDALEFNRLVRRAQGKGEPDGVAEGQREGSVELAAEDAQQGVGVARGLLGGGGAHPAAILEPALAVAEHLAALHFQHQEPVLRVEAEEVHLTLARRQPPLQVRVDQRPPDAPPLGQVQLQRPEDVALGLRPTAEEVGDELCHWRYSRQRTADSGQRWRWRSMWKARLSREGHSCQANSPSVAERGCPLSAVGCPLARLSLLICHRSSGLGRRPKRAACRGSR